MFTDHSAAKVPSVVELFWVRICPLDEHCARDGVPLQTRGDGAVNSGISVFMHVWSSHIAECKSTG